MGLLHPTIDLTPSHCIYNGLELNILSRIFVWIFMSLVCFLFFFFLMCVCVCVCVLPLSNVGIKVMLTSYKELRKLCFPPPLFFIRDYIELVLIL